MRTPELLLPAGGLDKMRAAYDFGADAVYAGQPRYSLRARNNEFKLQQLEQGIQEAKSRGKKLFVTSNLLAHNDKVRTYLRDIEPVLALKPDALIMADPGLIMQVKERWPDVAVHLSVQANTTNAAAVKFWQRAGVTRIILSRELSLDEIEAIRHECPDMELEVFVHGALCIAYSGRCYLSGYFNRRDPNQGTCTNACRWGYVTHGADADPNTGDAVARAAIPIQVDAEHDSDHASTYIMNSKDLRAVQHVARLARMGIDSLKVEGRTKSRYYVARTAQVYRRAIDDAVAGRPFNPDLLGELDGLANRGYTPGLLEPQRMDGYQNYATGYSVSQRSQFVAEVLGTDGQAEAGLSGDWLQVETKNHFAVGDTLEVVHPGGNLTMRLDAMRNTQGQPVDVAQGSPVRVWLPLPARYTGALLAKVLTAAG
ncbi:MAG TPA: U32 family peptidase [Burkholderiaceae bacterium]|nr:U32 family peptidase [Burkholderiaceae bacterium]